jgi:sarcosine oxidase subunit gamma
MLEPARVRAVLRLTAWSNTFSNGDLPSRVGMTVDGAVRVLCVAPGEWLFVSQEQDASSIRDALSPDLRNEKPSIAGRLERAAPTGRLESGAPGPASAGAGAVLVDITDGIAAFEMHGPAVRDLLAQGCGLDFHPRSFPPGHCARTRFAQIAVLIDCLDELRFVLYVSRSYAHYLQSWLIDAASTARAP